MIVMIKVPGKGRACIPEGVSPMILQLFIPDFLKATSILLQFVCLRLFFYPFVSNLHSLEDFILSSVKGSLSAIQLKK